MNKIEKKIDLLLRAWLSDRDDISEENREIERELIKEIKEILKPKEEKIPYSKSIEEGLTDEDVARKFPNYHKEQVEFYKKEMEDNPNSSVKWKLAKSRYEFHKSKVAISSSEEKKNA